LLAIMAAVVMPLGDRLVSLLHKGEVQPVSAGMTRFAVVLSTVLLWIIGRIV
jgi:hypothetical protein